MNVLLRLLGKFSRRHFGKIVNVLINQLSEIERGIACLTVGDLAVIRLVCKFESNDQVDVLNILLILLMHQFGENLILFLSHKLSH
jgi:hypothetical protein